ncbi:MAG: SLBB domain-containing protein [Fimbriimonadaceae bacterium]|nr:SLBB domain-containing protein [Fimbriimonadaceae bacterium]
MVRAPLRQYAFAACLLVLAALGIGQIRPAATLRIGDVITVRIIAVEGYDGEYRVLTDGAVTGLGFGRLEVEGRTIAQVQQAITDRMRRIMLDPKVEVVLKEQRLEYVYVSGQAVDAGGPVVLTEGLTLRALLAGKVQPTETEKFDVVLFRDGKEVLREDLNAVLGESEGMGASRLSPNDVVTVVPLETYRIWVTGAVNSPGEKQVRPGTDVYQAIAQSEGITLEVLDNTDARIVLRRGPNETEFPVQQRGESPPVALEPGDTLTVRTPQLLQVTVGGYVVNPQVMKVRQSTRLGEAIVKAGGVATGGTLTDVVIIRGSEAFRVDASGLTSGEEISPFPLMDGDAVYVRRNENTVAVLGAVNNAQSFSLEDNREYRLSDIIASAGGVSDRGSQRHIYVAKKSDDGRVIVKEYHLDAFLKDGDVSQNPVIQSGDVVVVGTPQGINISGISNLITSGALLRSLFGF